MQEFLEKAKAAEQQLLGTAFEVINDIKKKGRDSKRNVWQRDSKQKATSAKKASKDVQRDFVLIQ